MPLVLKEYIDPHTLVGLWEIHESAEEMLKTIGLRMEERSLYEGFRTEERRQHWLSYRLLVRELTMPDTYEVHYDNSGKPYLAGSLYHISVSHTEQLSAVILSDCHAVGIDIERVRPRIIRVRDKFLSKAELDSITPGDEAGKLTLYWCAKEALYKLFGERNLDFRENIFVDPSFRQDTGIFCGLITIPGFTGKYKLIHRTYGEYFLVYALSG
jgi:4'-phosphopantetheinyl transferase